MTRKKKKKRTPQFIKFAMPLPLGGKKTNKHFLVEAWRLQKAINILFDVVPDKVHVEKKLQELLKQNRMNWYGFILFAEILGIGAGKAYALLGEHFKKKESQKKRVGFLNPLMVESLLKKLDKWGGTPKAWHDHRKYIDAWCRKTGTPLFKTLKDFQTYTTAWREATVGKRKWSSSGISTKGDREFSILNPPPKS